jgi:hypothetical protein
MATSNFDFPAYNKLIESANSGLRLYLALQLLENVETTMRRFQSPLAKEMIDLVDELADLRKRNQEYLAKREKTTPSKIDNPEDLATSSTDIQTTLDRVKQAKDNGIIA